MKQILVVDDDPGAREVLSEILHDSYAIALATNGRQALDSMRQHLPDAIVLDMMMPVMDGRSFLLARRDQPECAGVPVMIVSAEPTGCRDGRRLGARACVPKPFDVDQILREMERLLAEPAH